MTKKPSSFQRQRIQIENTDILILTYTDTAPGMQPFVKLDKNLQVAIRVSSGTSKWKSCPSRYDLNSKILRPITVSVRMYFCGTVGGEAVKKEIKRKN